MVRAGILFCVLLTSSLGGIDEYLHTYGYLGIALWFMLIDPISPVPEEISLLTVGYLSSQGVFHPLLAGIIVVAAFQLIDSIYFFLARSGRNIIKRKYKTVKENAMLKRYNDRFDRNFGMTVITLAFIPNVRFLSPIIAGALDVPLLKYLFYNTVGLAAVSSIYITIGVLFHEELIGQLKELNNVRHIVFILSMVILALVAFLLFRKKRSASEKNPNDLV